MRRAQRLGVAVGGTLFAGALLVLALDRALGVPDPLSDVALAAGFLSVTLVPITLLVTIPLIDPDPGDPTALPPESVPPSRRCGASIDRYRSRLLPPPPATRERLTDVLRRTAVAALVEARGHTRASAREAVAAGTWTDDRRAARLLASDVDAPSAIVFTVYLRAATSEIDAILEVDP